MAIRNLIKKLRKEKPAPVAPKYGGAYEAVMCGWPYIENADGSFTSFGPGTPEYAEYQRSKAVA